MSHNQSNWQQPAMDAGNQMQQMIEQTQRQLSRTKLELDEAVSVRSQTPVLALRDVQQKDYEIEQLRNQVLYLEQQLNHQEREFATQLDAAQTRIQQQEATIRTQSRAIANPRPNKVEATPFRAPSEFVGGNYAPHLGGPPPSFDLLAAQTAPNEQQALRSIYGPIPPQQAHSAINVPSQQHDPFVDNTAYRTPDRGMNASRFGFTDERGSPMPFAYPSSAGRQNTQHSSSSEARTNPYAETSRTSDPRSGSQNLLSRFGHSNPSLPKVATHTPSPAKPQTPSGGNLISTARASPAKLPAIEPVIEAFNKVFDMAVRYGYIHVNFPSNYQDNRMPEHVKDRLLRAATQHTAFGLMSSQNTRYFLVGKVIIEWIIKNVLKEDTFKELDLAIDDRIASSRSQIYQSTPSPVRYLFLNAIAQEFEKLSKNTNFTSHVVGLCNQRGNELFGIIQPMMHNHTPNEWEDLRDLMVQGHILAQLMHSRIEEFRFDFPMFNDPFDSSRMVSVDPGHVGMNEAETMGHGRQIKFAAVPQVIARLTTAEGQTSTKTIIKASVLMR